MHPFLNLRILKFLPIHLRRTSHFVSELPVEVGKVAETIVVRDFGHTPRRTAQRLAGGFDPKLCQIFNGPEAEGLLKTAHKIAFAQMRQPGKFLYGNRVGEVLLDIGEHRPQVFSSRRHGGTIGAEFRRCGEQIEEAEQKGASADELKALLGKGRAKKGIFEGDLYEGELEIGQAASQLRQLQTVDEVMKELVEDYRTALRQMQDKQGW